MFLRANRVAYLQPVRRVFFSLRYGASEKSIASCFQDDEPQGANGLERRTGDLVQARNLPLWMPLALCVERQAAAVGVLLSFFRLSVLAFEVGERYVQRFAVEADSDGVP